MSSEKNSSVPMDDSVEEIKNPTEEAEAAVETSKADKGEKSKRCKKTKSDSKSDDGDDGIAEAMTKEAYNLACELKDEKDKYLRLAAEYDNYRKRSQKERESIYADVRADTVLKLLPVYDNLERAIKQETVDDAYSKGVEMTMTQLKEILAKLGVSEISATPGTAFDPLLHEAVMHVEDDSLGEGVIVDEFQKGFRLGDKVIRFSVVKVAN